MAKIIRQPDGNKKRKPEANDIWGFTNELALGEDDEEAQYYDNGDEEFL